MTTNPGGTFKGGTWDWPRMQPVTKLSPEEVEEMEQNFQAALAQERRRGFIQERPADPALPILLELVRMELVKLRLVLEQALQPRANGDTALEDIQRHWNVANRD